MQCFKFLNPINSCIGRGFEGSNLRMQLMRKSLVTIYKQNPCAQCLLQSCIALFRIVIKVSSYYCESTIFCRHPMLRIWSYWPTIFNYDYLAAELRQLSKR